MEALDKDKCNAALDKSLQINIIFHPIFSHKNEKAFRLLYILILLD